MFNKFQHNKPKMIKKEFEKYIKNYEDFPQKGILFRDILPILANPRIFNNLINEMAKDKSLNDCDAIIGIDARGFIFGTAIAIKLSKPLILARKPGKLPGELISKDYQLEYGKNGLSLQREALNGFNNFAIVDDLLATGGTVNCVSQILIEQQKKILGLSVVVELLDLNGSKKFQFPVSSQIKF
tara:strand:+ start:324 stop:875 length:552 start_codon:yes stop_codon:yes gene_type:complete